MKIKYAIFDLDGTLVDTLFLWDEIWNKFGEKYCGGKSFSPTAEEDNAFRTLPLAKTMEIIHENYGMGESGKELLDFANELIVDFYANAVELKAGVKQFIEYCYANGTKLCVASASAPDLIDLALKHCGIYSYFLNVLSCETLGKGKDRPDIYLQAQALLGGQAEETWVFEDSLTALRTAEKLGMPRVGIYDRCNDNQSAVKAHSTIYVGEGETLEKLIAQDD